MFILLMDNNKYDFDREMMSGYETAVPASYKQS